MSSTAKILLALAVIVGLIAGYWSLDKGGEAPIPSSDTVDLLGAATSTNFDLPGTNQPPLGGISFDLEPSTPAPSLTEPIVKPSSVESDVFEIARSQIEVRQTQLQSEKINYDLWVELGNFRNLIKDFENAEAAWKYASLIRPSQATAFINLGTLYEQQYKDYEQAEEYYAIAVELAPESPGSHIRLFDLYRFFLPEQRHLAPGVLIAGLEHLPDNLEFLIQLARFYAMEGDTDLSSERYEQAIEISSNFGDTKLASDLQEELDKLPQ